MRIAFTSCFSADLFPEQPVWKEIANAQPDVLVLLGDSIYLDQTPGLIPGVAHYLNPHGHEAPDAAAEAGARATTPRCSAPSSSRRSNSRWSRRNYGLLDIDAENLHIQLFKSNIVPQFRGTIDRQHWT